MESGGQRGGVKGVRKICDACHKGKYFQREASLVEVYFHHGMKNKTVILTFSFFLLIYIIQSSFFVFFSNIKSEYISHNSEEKVRIAK